MKSRQEVVDRELASHEDAQCEEYAGKAQSPVEVRFPLLDQSGLDYKKGKPEPVARSMDQQRGRKRPNLSHIHGQIKAESKIRDRHHCE
jgi:hypothetical protein